MFDLVGVKIFFSLIVVAIFVSDEQYQYENLASRCAVVLVLVIRCDIELLFHCLAATCAL